MGNSQAFSIVVSNAWKNNELCIRIYVFCSFVSFQLFLSSSTIQDRELMNTAVLTGRQVYKAMKVFIVSQSGKVADITLQSSCHSEDESVIKVCVCARAHALTP